MGKKRNARVPALKQAAKGKRGAVGFLKARRNFVQQPGENLDQSR
jgi:hypothetical protein